MLSWPVNFFAGKKKALIAWILLSVLWLAVAAGLLSFIVFFDRRKYLSASQGLFYIFCFYLVGVALLMGSLRMLH